MRHLWKFTRDGRQGHFRAIDKSHGTEPVSRACTFRKFKGLLNKKWQRQKRSISEENADKVPTYKRSRILEMDLFEMYVWNANSIFETNVSCWRIQSRLLHLNPKQIDSGHYKKILLHLRRVAVSAQKQNTSFHSVHAVLVRIWCNLSWQKSFSLLEAQSF